MEKMKVGVAGCGAISDIYLSNAAKFGGYDVIACMDLLPERAEAQAKKYGIEKVYNTLEQMLADPEVQIILDLTVHEAHYSVSMESLYAGKHIYNEKPLAATFDEGKKIIARAKENGLYVGCAPDTFLGARVQTMRKMLDSGKIGKPIGGVAYMICHGHECWHKNPFFIYEPGGGPIFDMGPYYLTALAFLLGPAKRVAGMVSTPEDKRFITSEHLYGQTIDVQVPTHINAMIEYQNGAIVNVIFTYDIWDSHLPRMEIFGSEGTMSMTEADPLAGPDIFEGEIEYRNQKDSDWMGAPETIPRKDPTEWEKIELAYPYAQNSRGVGLADMVYSIQHGIDNRANGEMALHVLEIAHAVHVSSETGRYYDMTTTFAQPKPFPEDIVAFSDSF